MAHDVDMPPENQADELREMIHIYAGLSAALARWPDVAALAVESESPVVFAQDLCDLLDIDQLQAVAVSEMQIQRVTRRDRDRVAQQLADLEAQLNDLDADDGL